MYIFIKNILRERIESQLFLFQKTHDMHDTFYKQKDLNMKYFKNKPPNVGSAFIESTDKSNTLGNLLETQKKFNSSKLGTIFAPLSRDQEMILANLTNNKRK